MPQGSIILYAYHKPMHTHIIYIYSLREATLCEARFLLQSATYCLANLSVK